MTSIRNICIVAHVDHGKTTLVDKLLAQSGTFRENQQVAERAMDSNDIERERGITILAKCTSILWKNVRINIVDTPGHADFSAEVERILSMVDGVVLLVDAAESVMPQTKFVVSKALKHGLNPIVVINKVDRPDSRIQEVHNEIFDLFANLDANEQQLDFPTVFASGRNGWATLDLDKPNNDLSPLLDLIVSYVPPAIGNVNDPFSMLVTTLEYDPYLGRILTGRINSGVIKPNLSVKSIRLDGSLVEQGRITKVLVFRGLERVPVESAVAGDIVAIAGLSKPTVADTICVPEVEIPINSTPIDPSTLSMTFSVNDSPLAGKEGTKLTSRMIAERLFREAESNVAIKVSESAGKDAYEVAGRGELQLGVIIENMRREGFELTISRPRVIYKDNNGTKEEPIEEVTVDVDDEYSGVVIDKMALRKALMIDMRPTGGNKQRIIFHAPTRGLIGYQGEFLADTRGTGVLSRVFYEYAPHKGQVESRRVGVLISTANGSTSAYSIQKLEPRGAMFVNPSVPVYQGMIIGQHSMENDLDVNPTVGKQLTNIRTTSKDEAVRVIPARIMSLEQSIAYIQDDELVEVTPSSIRLRKRHLDPNTRKRVSRVGYN